MLKPANARPEYVDANGDCTLLRETEKAIKRAATNPGARTTHSLTTAMALPYQRNDITGMVSVSGKVD